MNATVEHQIRATVEARLRELAPVAAEIEQLQHVLESLPSPTARELLGPRAVTAVPPAAAGAVAVAPGSPNLIAVPRPHRLGSRRGRDGRAPQGANKQRILAAIAAHPGLAAPEIARLTGLKRSVVASTISRLKRTGELSAHGDGVCLVFTP
ncbi:MAG: winged helix-turn-helix domain-containing protein [Solirubrobacterales bacterium]|nr:winged helix-turn-helix domain-containing protein [Solirubrobacterales bacterium]